MPRPPHPHPLLRKTLSLPIDIWQEISEFRHAARISSETEAVRCLLRVGLDAVKEGSTVKEGTKITTALRDIKSNDPVERLVAWHRLTVADLAEANPIGTSSLGFRLTDAGRAARDAKPE